MSRTGIASLVGLAGALVLGVVLGFVLAFGSSDRDPFEERWKLLGIPEAEFVFLGDFTGAERESLRQELKAAQVIFAEHFGAVTADFTVYVSDNVELLNERLGSDQPDVPQVTSTCSGIAESGVLILIFEDCPAFFRENGGPLAHEYFHILQWEARGPPARRLIEPGPRGLWLGWIIEGSAVYAEALLNDALGRRSLTAHREGMQVYWAALGQALPRIFTGIDDPEEEYSLHYEVGFLAADWLVERSGPEAILKFFRLGAHGAAFETAFGLSAQLFHDSFERYRWEVAAPYAWRVAGTVFGSDGAPVEGMEVYAGIRIEGETWVGARGETSGRGDFEMKGPGSGYTLGLFIRCPGDSEIPTWVHAGEWGATGLVADSDGIWDASAAGAEPFADGDQHRTGIVIEIPETRESLVEKGCEGGP